MGKIRNWMQRSCRTTLGSAPDCSGQLLEYCSCDITHCRPHHGDNWIPCYNQVWLYRVLCKYLSTTHVDLGSLCHTDKTENYSCCVNGQHMTSWQRTNRYHFHVDCNKWLVFSMMWQDFEKHCHVDFFLPHQKTLGIKNSLHLSHYCCSLSIWWLIKGFLFINMLWLLALSQTKKFFGLCRFI